MLVVLLITLDMICDVDKIPSLCMHGPDLVSHIWLSWLVILLLLGYAGTYIAILLQWYIYCILKIQYSLPIGSMKCLKFCVVVCVCGLYQCS